MTTVLLVDGSEELAPRYRSYLAHSPFRLMAASNADAVRAAASEAAVDVVLLAAPLPDGDALALIEESRAGDLPPDVVVLAAYDPAADTGAGAAPRILRPPMDATRLLVALRDIAERRELRRSPGGGARQPRAANGAERPRPRDVIEPLWQVEKRAIEEAIAACDGNVNRAAGLLEVAPSTLYRKRQQWRNAGID